jgi:hypothetical protein
MDIYLVNLRVTKGLLDGLKSATEEVLAKLFETSMSEGAVENDTQKASRSR